MSILRGAEAVEEVLQRTKDPGFQWTPFVFALNETRKGIEELAQAQIHRLQHHPRWHQVNGIDWKRMKN
jgi:hypothetical protein